MGWPVVALRSWVTLPWPSVSCCHKSWFVSSTVFRVLSGAMLLRRLGWAEKADRVEAAVRAVIAGGQARTPDLGGSGTTRQFTQAVIEHVRG